MSRRGIWIVSLGVVLLAAALRLVHLGMYELWWDEVLTQASAVQLARHGEWVWVGNPTSMHKALYHSPFGVYVTAVPYLFSTHILGPRLLYALLGTATVAATLLLVRRYFGVVAALIAALLVAVNPLALYWSRFAWHPNIAPLCIVLWMFTGLLGYYEGKRWAQIAHWLLLSAIVQANTALGVIAPLSAGLVIARRAWNKTTLIAVGLVALSLVPWMIGLVGIQQGWFEGPPPNELGRSLGHLALPRPEVAARTIAHLTGRYGYHITTLSMSDHPAAWWPDHRLNIGLAIHTLVVVIGAVMLLRRRWVERFIVVVLLWPLVFLLYAQETLFDFYMMASVFAADMVFGIVFGRLWRWQRATVVVAILLIAGQAWLALALLDREHRSDQVFSLSELITMARRWNEAGGEVVVLDEQRPGESYLIQQEWRLKWQILGEMFPIRVVTEPHAFPVSKGGETLVSVAEGSLIPALFGEGELAPTRQRVFRWTVITPADLPDYDRLPGGEFVGTARVKGISAAPNAQESWPLFIIWEPLRVPNQRYHFSVRLVGESGASYGQVDGVSLEPSLWRPGDTVLTRFMMPPLPEGAVWHVDLLLYSWPDLINVPVAGQGDMIMRLQPPNLP